MIEVVRETSKRVSAIIYVLLSVMGWCAVLGASTDDDINIIRVKLLLKLVFIISFAIISIIHVSSKRRLDLFKVARQIIVTNLTVIAVLGLFFFIVFIENNLDSDRITITYVSICIPVVVLILSHIAQD